jgi:hypothetical protein
MLLGGGVYNGWRVFPFYSDASGCMSAELMGSALHWFRCFEVDEQKADGEHTLSLEMLWEMKR